MELSTRCLSMTCDVCAIIERETGQKVTKETELESLNVDSLEFLELLMKIGDESGKEISDERIPSLKTVGDIAKEIA
jgi:acyl carrier protein